MYELPPDLQNNDLNQMWSSVPFNDSFHPSRKQDWLINIIAKAQKLDIAAAYHKTTPPGSDNEHEYLLLSTDKLLMNNLKRHNFNKFDRWLDRQKFQDRGTVLLDKVVIDVTDIDKHNYFSKNSYIMRYIQNMSIVNTAFRLEKLPVPDHVSTYVVSSIWELDQMRSNSDVEPHLRNEYEKIYKNAVAEWSQMYAKKYNLEEVPHESSHQVKEDYFKKNHIPITWDVVNTQFFKFIKAELKADKYPDFIFYKSFSPYIKIKNLAKKFDKIVKDKDYTGPNFWANDTGVEKYYICYPTSQRAMFYNMRNDFNTRMYETKIPLETLAKSSQHNLQLLTLHQFDFENWNRLCKANNVSWSLNDGSYGEYTFTPSSTLEELPVLYRVEDKKIVNGIVDLLSREMRNYMPLSDMTRNEKLDKQFDIDM